MTLGRQIGLSALCVAALAVAPAAHATDLGHPAACPTTDVRVTRSVGGTTEYHGTVAGIDDLCRVNRPDGNGNFYFGAWRSDWPGAGDAYPAIRAVLFGGKGARATFDTHSVPGWQWHDTLINEGTVPLEVDGKTYTTVMLAHEREGFGGNYYHSIITSWRDVQTGITLKTVENQISGASYGPATTWTATKVEQIP